MSNSTIYREMAIDGFLDEMLHDENIAGDF